MRPPPSSEPRSSSWGAELAHWHQQPRLILRRSGGLWRVVCRQPAKAAGGDRAWGAVWAPSATEEIVTFSDNKRLNFSRTLNCCPSQMRGAHPAQPAPPGAKSQFLLYLVGFLVL